MTFPLRLAYLAVPLILGTAVAACAAPPQATSTAAAPTKAATATTAAASAPSTSAPATPPAGITPVANTDLETGRTVFTANCNACHPAGGQGVGPAIKGRSADLVKATIRSGRGNMPAFSAGQISDAQLNAVAAYVASLR